ncbi:PCYCGC motif-containing (lipo)protein [Gemmatimonas sp.]
MSTSRRSALVRLAGLFLLTVPRVARGLDAHHAPPTHPTPRKGITGSKVATPAMLSRSPHLVPLFDEVRATPQIVDGIRCHCGCADLDGHYSLLTCYEGEDAMAKICPICQGMGRVAVRMHKAGRSLDEIRVAVDAQFG